ncbi:Putative glycosyl transferase CAP10 domain-containing protein [Septoria linicola]|uniref:Glycosyl transferase CAP10 domain-containing protein n=1 Tax=Septoria linicola TaxID=215465 RepID=A0A9Q9EIW8_9PEZI|nr:putative glycosyl transferase CAP10 domain-containing protein [Septoria linicola]USW51497.1 Putative glycosyl transferase CAP10 domain-containing protein [Septoria linicola]
MIWTIWYGMNSDKDDIPAILTQVIPAGHATCQQATLFECSSCLEQHDAANKSDPGLWQFEYGRHDRDESLSESQCEAAFPGLFEDIHQGKHYWQQKRQTKITPALLDGINIKNGMTRAVIFDGDLYIIQTKSTAEDHRRKTLAILSSIHRALAAASDRRTFPNIEFVFSIEDKATDVTSVRIEPLWVVARKASEESFFLLPDFGYWAWDNIIDGKNNEVGPYDEVVHKALAFEEGGNFFDKTPQLVWRGKLSFAPKLRRGLIDAARGKEWSDVKELNWSVKHNFLALDEHCRYMFIAHVEGRSYSASLKYRQACRSVIVAHKLQYIQHYHYLLVAEGPHQNFVQVARDFSDLTPKIEELLANPVKAKEIADNSVGTFRERYLTPAAEACYWRALIRGYSSVSEEASIWHTLSSTGKKTKRGLRYETFILLSSEEMMNYMSVAEG